MYESPFKRHKTRVVDVGGVPVGGDNPIVVQSMTTPDTNQFEAVLNEIRRLEELIAQAKQKQPSRRKSGKEGPR